MGEIHLDQLDTVPGITHYEIPDATFARATPLDPGNFKLDIAANLQQMIQRRAGPIAEIEATAPKPIETVADIPLKEYRKIEYIHPQPDQLYINAGHLPLAFECGLIDPKDPEVEIYATERLKNDKGVEYLATPVALIPVEHFRRKMADAVASDEIELARRQQAYEEMLSLSIDESVPTKFREVAKKTVEKMKVNVDDPTLLSNKLLQLAIVELKTNMTFPSFIVQMRRMMHNTGSYLDVQSVMTKDPRIFNVTINLAQEIVSSFPQLKNRFLYQNNKTAGGGLVTCLAKANDLVREARELDKLEWEKKNPKPVTFTPMIVEHPLLERQVGL